VSGVAVAKDGAAGRQFQRRLRRDSLRTLDDLGEGVACLGVANRHTRLPNEDLRRRSLDGLRLEIVEMRPLRPARPSSLVARIPCNCYCGS
jgi:hypothetical protein